MYFFLPVDESYRSRCLTSRLLTDALPVSLATAAQAAPLPYDDDTHALFVIRGVAHGGDFDCFGDGGRCAGSQQAPVTFCDVTGPHARCEDSAIVGTAQLNGATATFKFIPGDRRP